MYSNINRIPLATYNHGDLVPIPDYASGTQCSGRTGPVNFPEHVQDVVIGNWFYHFTDRPADDPARLFVCGIYDSEIPVGRAVYIDPTGKVGTVEGEGSKGGNVFLSRSPPDIPDRSGHTYFPYAYERVLASENARPVYVSSEDKLGTTSGAGTSGVLRIGVDLDPEHRVGYAKRQYESQPLVKELTSGDLFATPGTYIDNIYDGVLTGPKESWRQLYVDQDGQLGVL